MDIFVSLIVIVVLFAGIFLFKNPESVRLANIIAAFSMLLATIYVFSYNDFEKEYLIIIAIIAGSLFGYIAAIMVDMTLVPAMVAFQHGMGGIAAFIVAYIELTKTVNTLQIFEYTAGIVSIIVGAATFSASMIASLKLSGKVRQTPIILKWHNLILCIIIIIAILTGSTVINLSPTLYYMGVIILICISVVFGVFFSIRIGGADMPVLISFLNATAGLAAAFCGIILHNNLLIAFGATVAASGSVLTFVMCKAMNRSLLNIFIGYKTIKDVKTAVKEEIASTTESEPANIETFDDGIKKAVDILNAANNIIIIPGYGMALARAQFEVKQLADLLIDMGKDVKFAIHPIAGRMPGHMNVLLAEAEVPYDRLYEMDDINDKFKDVEATIIVGACDVVNPAAVQTEGTPISGMPILHAHESKNVLILNFDEKPGYSGVENPLYRNNKCVKLFGDAKATLEKIIKFLSR